MVVACLMGAFNSIGGGCFAWLGERLKTEAALLIAYADNLENLRRQVQNLTDAIESLGDRIEEAENNGGATLVDAVVKRLLERMASLREEASKLIRDEEQDSDSRCLMGLRPNLWACYLISKSARKMVDEAVELLEEEKKIDRPVAIVDYSVSSGVTPITYFEEFESRVLVSNQIVAALKDPNVNMVGVYGMSGAGKTTIAEKIGADLQLDKTFSYVVLATVSKKQNQLEKNYEANLLNIQEEIVGGLKIQLQGKNLKDRAAELYKQLQKKDQILIIFDDIWCRFELRDVGIPVGGGAHKKLKILMTSRSQDVLLNQMDSTSNFGLDSLSSTDAWKLFDKMVGGDSEYSNWRPTAEKVVEQCGGIPILIVTIARSLRNKDSKIWDDTLTQLKQFDIEDIVEVAYKMIEVSYNFLKNEEMKRLFLLCAQLDHRSIQEEDLLKYAMGLDLFKKCKKVKEVSNRLHKYLHDLKGCCLLQDGNEEGVLKMHDVVHKFASFVASRDHYVFTVADGELEDWPSKDELEDFSAISLPYCHLPPDHMLPAAFDNPKLVSFLMLRSEFDEAFEIPDNFFARMKGLKLMNLTRMSLSPVLVLSLSALIKLRTLCLDHCELSDITVIGELPMLQALSLIGSSIVLVPKEIGKLGSTLKLLDLRNCWKLQVIASGVISRLTLLEDLRIGASFMSWEQLEGSDKSSNSDDDTYEAEVCSLEEFKNLGNLINLEIHILEHAKMFPKDLVFKKLETFRIFIGMHGLSSNDYILTRTLEVKESYTPIEFDSEGTKALVTRAESLLLEEVMSSVSVSEMDPKGFPELKHLKVGSEDPMLNYIVNYEDKLQYIVKMNYNNCIFPKLETLDLLRLFNLERICDDHDHPLPIGSFENLRVISVSRCDLLNDLLSSNLARALLRLKEIRVESCESMETIVSGENENEEEIKIGFSHQLRVLDLCRLPCLVSFYNFKQLEGLPSPAPLFNKKIVFPKLEELYLSWMKIEKIWDVDHLAFAAEGTCWFQNLTSLKVYACENLSYLFPFSMVKWLTQLKNLEISNCESIEEIVAMSDEETEGERWLSFPKLEYLELEALPNLNFFCHANLLECQSLQKLKIQECPMLYTFIGTNDSTHDPGANSLTSLFDEKIVFPKLEKLDLTRMKIEKIWNFNHLAIVAEEIFQFQNLTSLHIEKCPNLSYLFTSSMVKSLAKLKQLEVYNCKSIEAIVASTEFLTSLQPQLERLDIRYCDKIDFFGFNNTQHQLNDAFAKVISSLKYCYLESRGLKLKYEHQRFKAKVVGCGFQVYPILIGVLNSFPKLDKVVVSRYSIVQLFSCEPNHLAANDMDTQVKTLARIQHLKLNELSKMKHIWSEQSLLKHHGIPLDLKVLEVTSCDSLLSLATPSTTLFKNLTSLVVWYCRKLIKLVASSSTAKSLVNLKEMSVRGCDSLEEIVTIDDEWEELASNDQCSIVFDQLEVLKLEDLNSLTSFCSKLDWNFRFPSLNRVVVENCPKIKFFSRGALSTPKLIRVDEDRFDESYWRWEGDLNSTIRHLFEKKEEGDYRVETSEEGDYRVETSEEGDYRVETSEEEEYRDETSEEEEYRSRDEDEDEDQDDDIVDK